MKKKLISCVVAAVLLISSSVCAFATTETSNAEKTTYLNDEQGSYTLSNKDADNSIAAKEISKGVYSLENEKTVIEPVKGSFEEVDSYEIKLSDKNAVKDILSNPYIDDENKAMIANLSKLAIDSKNKIAMVTIYLPKQITTNTTGLMASSGTTTTKYLYKGVEFVDVWYKYTGLDTNYMPIASGTTASTIAKGVYGIIISATGVASTSVSLFTSAVSAYQYFCSGTSLVPLGTGYEDSLQARVEYDRTVKITSKVNGNASIHTEDVYMKKIYTHQYYYTNMQGKSYDSTVTKNKHYKTQNYDNPAAWVLANPTGTRLESVTAKIYNKSIAW